MNPAVFLVWLAVIAVGSQIVAVLVMWQLQRLTMLEIHGLNRADQLTKEERLARVEQEARITAEATGEAVMRLQRQVAGEVLFRRPVTEEEGTD